MIVQRPSSVDQLYDKHSDDSEMTDEVSEESKHRQRREVFPTTSNPEDGQAQPNPGNDNTDGDDKNKITIIIMVIVIKMIIMITVMIIMIIVT